MDVEQIRQFCLSFPGVTEDMKWGEHLCFSVAGKMFLMMGLDQLPVNMSFKVPKDELDDMSARDGWKPAPYLARASWVMVDDIALLGEKMGKIHIQTAYELVFARLPARAKALYQPAEKKSPLKKKPAARK